MPPAPVIPVGIGLDRARIRLIETSVDGTVEVGTWYFGGPYAMTVGAPLHFAGEAVDRALVHTTTERIMQRVVELAGQSAYRVEGMHSPSIYVPRSLAALAERQTMD